MIQLLSSLSPPGGGISSETSQKRLEARPTYQLIFLCVGNHCQSIGASIFNLLYQIGSGIGSIRAEDENVVLWIYGQHLQKEHVKAQTGECTICNTKTCVGLELNGVHQQ